MSRLGFPYPTLFPVVNGPARWEAVIGEETRAFRDGCGSWDYQSELEIRARLDWQPEQAFQRGGLSKLWENSRLAILLSSGSNLQQGRRFVAIDRPITEISGDPVEIRFRISSASLCSRLVAVLLIYSMGGLVAGIPIRRGSVLYKEQAVLSLEGDLAAFPVRSISFSHSHLPDGFWLVDVSPTENLFDPILSSVTLLLNSDRPDIVSRVLTKGEADGFLRWILRADLMACVLSTVLLRQDLGYDRLESYPDGSMGHLTSSMLQGLGIGSEAELSRLQEEARVEPGRFRQRCQAVMLLDSQGP
ncbi:MAG: hypothetical protein ERJ68_00440 [Aphanocapsa feldmannii 277cI]|uniref:Uncharacterized protein n=1 Tax=Aphanocapsa feldmannii 277cI TaxID=2507554 RepID=A0A524RVQ8_9CHRO|nr:MAG: hypothetical protein ERJ68_00440 [Aphanocapsa feldmannii 277cI]